MARFAHAVTVAALDRGWFEEAAGALVDLLDASREGPGRIGRAGRRATGGGPAAAEGRHLRPGARYGEVPAAPEGAGEVPVEHAGAERFRWSMRVPRRATPRCAPGRRPAHLAAVALRRGGEPRGGGRHVPEGGAPAERAPSARAVELSLSGQKPGGGSLVPLLGAWQGRSGRLVGGGGPAPSAPPAARAPVSGRAVHRLAKARLTLTPRPAEDGSWRITVVLSMRGRWLLRPVGAVVLFFARGPVERGLRERRRRARPRVGTRRSRS